MDVPNDNAVDVGQLPLLPSSRCADSRDRFSASVPSTFITDSRVYRFSSNSGTEHVRA